MRDIVLVIIFPILLFFIFKRPFIGSSLWIWSAIFFPNGWVYGFASTIRFNLLIAVTTFVSYAAKKNKIKIQPDKLTYFIFTFMIWGTISSLFSESTSEVIWFEWGIFVKIIIFYFISIAVLSKKIHIDTLLWCITLSVGFLGAFEGVKFVASGGGHILTGIKGSRLYDRNELALALNMCIPIMIYLAHTSSKKWIALGLYGGILLSLISILGSLSRGGLIGVIILGAFFILNSKHKLLIFIGVIIIGFTASSFMPERFYNRMSTIQNAQLDASFLGRVGAWKQAVLMAGDNPVFGAGFKAGQNPAFWHLYNDEFSRFDFIIDTSTKDFSHVVAAHSIYFQVLGDLGFAGLMIFLIILYLAFKKLSKLSKASQGRPLWLCYLSQMLRLSLIVYAVGGAALSLPYFDFTFAILALVHVLTRIDKTYVVVDEVNYSQT